MDDDPMQEVNGLDYDPAADEVNSQDGDVEDPAELPPRGSGVAMAMEGHENDFEHPDTDSEEEEEEDMANIPDVQGDGLCSVKCRDRTRQHQIFLDQLRDDHAAEIRVLNEELAELEDQMNELRLENERLRAHKPRQTTKTWPDKLDEFFAKEEGTGIRFYETIVYPLSCMEENMSPNMVNVHPNLTLRKYTHAERRKETARFRREEEDRDYQWLREDIASLILDAAASLDDDDELFVPMGSPEPPAIERLPKDIQARVIRHLFDFRGKLVHCLSRLDFHVAPVTLEAMEGRGKLPKRFHIATTKGCSIQAATRPDELLRFFKVSKFWYFIGVHAFYGLNTFAFSSLGEFGRFMGGIGTARRERIQNVEMLWIGSQKVCFEIGDDEKYVSRRTWFAHWLLKMPRLRNLVVHLHETHKSHIRRGHETTMGQNFMAKQSQGQPNYRRTRSLRTIQGVDFIYALRGMKSVIFYDFTKRIELGGGRHFIRDWGFYMDIEHQVKQKKSKKNQIKANLRNLARLLPSCTGQDDFLELVRPFYADSDETAFDNGQDIPAHLVLPPAPQNNDSDSDSDSDSNSDLSDDEDDDNDDDDGGSDDDDDEGSDDNDDEGSDDDDDGGNDDDDDDGGKDDDGGNGNGIDIGSEDENDIDIDNEDENDIDIDNEDGNDLDIDSNDGDNNNNNNDDDDDDDDDSDGDPFFDADESPLSKVGFKRQDIKTEQISDIESDNENENDSDTDDILQPQDHGSSVDRAIVIDDDSDDDSDDEGDDGINSEHDTKPQVDVDSDQESLAQGLGELGIVNGDMSPGSRGASRDMEMEDAQQPELDAASVISSPEDEDDEPELSGFERQAEVFDLTQDDEVIADRQEPSRHPAPSPALSISQHQRQQSEVQILSRQSSVSVIDATGRTTTSPETLFLPGNMSPPAWRRGPSSVANSRTSSRELSGTPAVDQGRRSTPSQALANMLPNNVAFDEQARMTQEARIRAQSTLPSFAKKRKSPDSDDETPNGKRSKR